MSEIHALVSSSKALLTWTARDAIQEAREACGGHVRIYLKQIRFYQKYSTKIRFAREINCLHMKLFTYEIQTKLFRVTTKLRIWVS